VKIFASGGLDEDDLLEFTRTDAPIDGYGIGTSLTTSSDAAALDCAYKLQEYAGTPRRKKSEGKATWPGRKQVYRRFDADGRMAGDLIALEDERDPDGGEALLRPVLRGGKRVAGALPDIAESRETAARNLAALPEPLRRLEPGFGYAVDISQRLKALAAETDRAFAAS
jgi:nicotinate phosphoribosyltransferase